MEDFKQIIAEHPVLATLTVIFIILFLLSRLGLRLLNQRRKFYGNEWDGMYYDKFKKMSDPLSSDEVKFLKKYSKVKSLTAK
jgi:hypothetical protein